MKPLATIAALGVLLLSAAPMRSWADGCYLCKEGGYIRYTGPDTFPKRKKAKEQFGCTVNGTAGICSHPRGTVVRLSPPALTKSCRARRP